MTIQRETCITLPLIGNALNRAWPYEFLIPDSSSAKVVLRNNLTGEDTVIPSTAYAISGVGNADGGFVTYPLSPITPISSDYSIIISRNTPYAQGTSFAGNQGGFNPRVLEGQLDKIVMQIQQLKEQIDRAIKYEAYVASIPSGHVIASDGNGGVVDGGSSTLPIISANGGSVGKVAFIDTAANVGGTTIATGTKQIVTQGFSAFGDGGGATYDYWDAAAHGGNSYPETYIIANKILNGDFLIDKYWAKPTGFTISGSQGLAANCTGDLTQSMMTMAGFYDEITFRLYSTSNADPTTQYLQVLVGSAGDSVKYTADGLYTVRVLRAGSGGAVANPNLIFRMVNFTGGIRSVTVRQVYKPVYGVLTATFADGSTGYFYQSKNINPKGLGAKGDGISDDTLYLRDATLFNCGLNSKVIFPDGDYVYTAWLTTFLGHPFDNVAWKALNKGKARFINKCTTNDYNMLTIRGTMTSVADAEPLIVAAPQQSNRLRVAAPAANYYGTADAWLCISDPSQIIYNQSTGLATAILGEMVQVEKTENTSQIKLRQVLQYSYTTSAVIQKVRRPSNISLEDITILQQPGDTVGLRCYPLIAVYAEKIRVSGCHFEGMQSRILDIDDFCHDYRITDCTAKNLYDNTIVPTYFISVGVGTTDGFVADCRLDKVRHHITSGGVATAIEADRCSLVNCISFNSEASGFDSHMGGIRNMIFENCHAYRKSVSGQPAAAFFGIHGFQMRSRFIKLNNCSATGYWVGVYATQGSDCHIRNFDSYSNMIGVKIGDSPRTSIKGLRVFGDHAQAVLIENSGTVTPMERVTVEDIEVYGTINGDNATGSVTLTTNPSDGHTFVLNGFTFNFKNVPGANTNTSTDILIAGTKEDTALALLTAIKENPFSNLIINNLAVSLAATVSNAIIIYARQPGTGGNSITLAQTGGSCSISGATLTGGGNKLAAVYYSYWDDSFVAGAVRLPVNSTVPKFGGVIPDAYAYGYSSITATATIKPVPHTILADTTAGAITLNLPTAASMKGQRLRTIKTAGANTLTWDGNGAETIDGSATKTVTTNASIISNGTAWFTESAG